MSEVLWELTKCDTETPMLLGKWHRKTWATQACLRPSVYRKCGICSAVTWSTAKWGLPVDIFHWLFSLSTVNPFNWADDENIQCVHTQLWTLRSFDSDNKHTSITFSYASSFLNMSGSVNDYAGYCV